MQVLIFDDNSRIELNNGFRIIGRKVHEYYFKVWKKARENFKTIAEQSEWVYKIITNEQERTE